MAPTKVHVALALAAVAAVNSLCPAEAFVPPSVGTCTRSNHAAALGGIQSLRTSTSTGRRPSRDQRSSVAMAEGGETSSEVKAAPLVTGEQLEIMLTEWDEPLVVDAYATWCGPCLLMAPEFEAAAKELKGKVRFVKIDTDQEAEMAARLNIMGLPTLLFLDKFEPEEGSDEEAKAVLKDRIEGAIRKDSIMALCDHHFFGGPRPEQL